MSTCKPLGFSLPEWLGVIVAVVALISLLFKGVRAVLGRLWRGLSALVIRITTTLSTTDERTEPEPEIDPLLAKPDREVRGRDADIERIDRAFKDRGNLPAVAITGPGGCGKTTLAGEYARRRARRYRGVWLVDATSLTEVRNGLARLGAQLGIDVPYKAEEGIDCVLNALKAKGGRWLLIHDNIVGPDRLAEFQYQVQYPDCIDHLLTSRLTDLTGKAKTVALDVLPGDDAVALLAAESERDGEAGLAKMATIVLDRHPLALVIAGQILHSDKKLSVAELSARFHERLKDVPQSDTYTKSQFVTVEKSLDRLDADAQALLKLAAFLSPDDIAPEYLVDGVKAIAARGWESLPEPLASLANDEMRRGDAFAACREHFLLTAATWVGPDIQPPTHRIQRVTQLVLRDLMGAETRAQMIGLAARLGRAQFSDEPQYDVAAWPRCHRLAPHARALAPLAAKAAAGDRQTAADFVHITALFLSHATGDLAEARRLYEANLAVMAAAFGAESNEYGAALGNLAAALDHLGEDADAERRFREAIAVLEAATEEGDPSRGHTRNNLGAFYWRRKRFAEAEPELKAALDIFVAAYGGQGELVGASYGNLGALYSDWADATDNAALRQRALVNKRKGLKITRTALGPLNFDMATFHHNLARDLAVTEAQEDAATHQLRAAAIPLAMVQAKRIAQGHPQIAERLAPLEHYFREAGREADIARLDELLEAEATAVRAEHAEWLAAQDAPPASEA